MNIKESIKKDYIFGFISNTDLAKKYGLHRTTIQRYLKENNVVLRKKTPKTKVNHFFFSEYNEKSCYWAGFILADGYIRSDKRFVLEIKLQKKDTEHLRKLKRDINFEGKIVERDDYVSITISSSQLINDLKNHFDIKTKKSLTCSIYDKIPKKWLKDYIRGYFDGDGSITYTTTHTINFIGTEKTVSFIRDYFYNLGIKLRSKEKPDITKNKNIYVINYSGLSAYKCLVELYKKSEIYLARKYALFLKINKVYND